MSAGAKWGIRADISPRRQLPAAATPETSSHSSCSLTTGRAAARFLARVSGSGATGTDGTHAPPRGAAPLLLMRPGRRVSSVCARPVGFYRSIEVFLIIYTIQYT